MFKILGTALPGPIARVCRFILDFRSNKRGNTAIMFALSAIPVVAAIGCVVDYSYASMIKTKLQAAADAAAVATVSNNSPISATAKSMTGNGAVSGGSTYVQNFFGSDTTAFSGVSDTGTVTKSGMTVTATLTYSYSVPTTFLKVIGYSNIALSGSSTASVTLATYISFYLMLDVSGSMGMPSTTAEMTRLQSVNPDNFGQYPSGCTFACHFTTQGACGQSNQGPIPAVGNPTNPSPGGYCQGFIISRLGTTPASITSGTNSTNGNDVNWTNPQVSSCASPGTTSCIQLRLDAVGYAG
jgi:Flp pilus assembly protein TadG